MSAGTGSSIREGGPDHGGAKVAIVYGCLINAVKAAWFSPERWPAHVEETRSTPATKKPGDAAHRITKLGVCVRAVRSGKADAERGDEQNETLPGRAEP